VKAEGLEARRRPSEKTISRKNGILESLGKGIQQTEDKNSKSECNK
jgi:hypothetical protein